MAPLDVVAAESEQASREEAVILAEAAVADAEDALKRPIFNTNDPAMWDTRIVPAERPTAEPFTVDTRRGHRERPGEAHRHRDRAQAAGERGVRRHLREEPEAARRST